MYEQVSHAILNQILDDLDPRFYNAKLRFFHSRLGANFFSIHSLFSQLYGDREDFNSKLHKLVEVMAKNYVERNEELKQKDLEREANHDWFLSQNWVAMALYANGFAKDLKGIKKHIQYFSDLGVNLIHILPIMQCPVGKSDGGYAVSDFRSVDSRVGTNEDLYELISETHKQDSLIVLDMVVNHTSDEHEWARRAREGDKHYQDYYYTFDNRDIPDMFELTMPDVFPETDPGNFTYDESIGKWVMTVFYKYQWDLNYTNPDVFIEMLDCILFWANKGVDVLRLDAVAFLWKKIGTISQNEKEAHLILQLFKDCCQVVSPGLLFIAEAIVAPSEIIKYFGEDAIAAKECEIAYNATFMALIWDAVATKNARLLNEGIKSLPTKFENATWLNYLRCHDDIGFGFDNEDIARAGYEPHAHRRFLLDYFTGNFEGSLASGRPFGIDKKTGDARVSGSLASLVGLENALKKSDPEGIKRCINHILVLHSLIMSFGGIPLLYYGDEVGMLNDYSYEDDEQKFSDSRWIHRPNFDWQKIERRLDKKSVEGEIFNAIKRMIAIRKTLSAFADFNNRDLIHVSNPHIFAYLRYIYTDPSEKVLVVVNLSPESQQVSFDELTHPTYLDRNKLVDKWTKKKPSSFGNNLILGGFQFMWLKQR